MKFKQLTLICVMGLLLSGCEYIGAFLVCIPKTYIEHPNFIKLDYYDNPEWRDYKNLTLIRERIRDYLNKNTDINSEVKNSLENLSFKKGMTKEQVILVIGNPVKKRILKNKSERWIYSGVDGGVLQWYYRWGKLEFSDERLTDIEVQCVQMCDL